MMIEREQQQAYSDADYSDQEDFDAFDASDDVGGMSGLSLLIAGALVFAAFSAVVWVAYQQGLRQGGREAPPLVVASPEPIKTPGPTAQADNGEASREVFSRVADGAPVRAERVRAEPEEPIARPASRGVTTAADASFEAPAGADPQSGAARQTSAQPSAAPAQARAEPARQSANAADRGSEPAASSSGAVRIPAPPGARDAAANPARLESAAPQTRPAEAQPAIGGVNAAAGTHVVQIAAFRSNEEALTAWRRLESRHSELMGSLGPDIQRADLGERGVYYRLRVGPFYQKSDADALCAALKDRGQDCLVRSL